MIFCFQGILKILASIFHYFFQEETTKPKSTAFERLISASTMDRMEYVKKQLRNGVYCGCKELTKEPLLIFPQHQESVPHNATQIPDIKKQFKMWSDNMKEYDSIRKRLLDSV